MRMRPRLAQMAFGVLGCGEMLPVWRTPSRMVRI